MTEFKPKFFPHNKLNGNNIFCKRTLNCFMMVNNSTNITKLCPYLNGSIPFGIESIFLLILAVTSVMFNLAFLRVLFNCGGHLPLNTKLLLIHGCIAATLKSFSFALQSIYNFSMWGLGFDKMAMNRNTCIIIGLPYAISSIALLNSMSFVGFERMWATWHKNLSNIEVVGWRIISAQAAIWIASCVIYIIVMTLDEGQVSSLVCYCYFPMITSLNAAILNNVLFIGTQTLNMMIYGFVYWKNKKVLFEFTMNTARHSLSERFVMWANVKASKMLIPDSIMHAVTYDCVIVLIYALRQSYSVVSDEYLCIMVLIFCILCIDTLIHPILCLRFNYSLKEIAVNFYPKLSFIVGQIELTAETMQDNHDSTASKKVQKHVNMKEQHRNSSLTSGNLQNACAPLGTKTIVEFRVAPEHHQDILKQMWETDGKRNNHSKRKIKQVTDIKQTE